MFFTSNYGDGVGKLYDILINPNAPITISKGTWAVKFCSKKILQFFTEGGG